MRRRSRLGLVLGSVGLGAVLVVLAGSPSGAATANVDTYAISGTELFADLGACLNYTLSGSLHYAATPLHRLPGISRRWIGPVTLTDPTLAVAAVAYDPNRRACTTRPVRWDALSVHQVWTGLDAGSGLEGLSYGPSGSATEYNSGVSPRFGSTVYTNLTRGHPPCHAVSVDLELSIGPAQSGRWTPARAVCLTPTFSE